MSSTATAADAIMEAMDQMDEVSEFPIERADLVEELADRCLSDKGKLHLAQTMLRQIGRSEEAGALR